MLALCGCVSVNGVIPIGNNTYLVTSETAGFKTDVDIEDAAIEKANSYCNGLGKKINIVKTSTSGVYGFTPLRSKVEFKCLSPQELASTGTENNRAKNNSQNAVSFGTAFAIDVPNIFVTADHVIENAKNTIELRCPNGQTGNAQVVAVDIANDLVALHSTVKAQAFLVFAPDNSVSLGDHVFTVGFPAPGLLGVDPKYSNGVVSSLTGIEDTRSLMQITIPIQPGNSGGAVADAQGRVVGVVVSSAAIPFFAHYTGTLPQNVNWAVRSYYVRPLLTGIEASPDERVHQLTPVERVTESTCLIEAQ